MKDQTHALTLANSGEHVLIAGLRGGRLSYNRLEVEFALAFLIEHAIASGAAAAHVHPVGGHHHDRRLRR